MGRRRLIALFISCSTSLAAAHIQRLCRAQPLSCLFSSLLLPLPLLAMSARSQRESKAVRSREPQIAELQNAAKVSKGGTEGNAAAARTRDAVRELAESLHTIPAGSAKNDAINDFNKLVRQYDAVIVHYVSKSRALRNADDTIVQLQDSMIQLRDQTEETRQQLEGLMANRRGCGCRARGAQCTGTCGCSREGRVVACGSHCSCDPTKCQNRLQNPPQNNRTVRIQVRSLHTHIALLCSCSPLLSLCLLLCACV